MLDSRLPFLQDPSFRQHFVLSAKGSMTCVKCLFSYSKVAGVARAATHPPVYGGFLCWAVQDQTWPLLRPILETTKTMHEC